MDAILDLAVQLKADFKLRRSHADILRDRTLFMMIFSPSTRTRNSFEVGIHQLGGHGYFMLPNEPTANRLPTFLNEVSPDPTDRIADLARMFSRMGDGVAVRLMGDKVAWEYDKGYRFMREWARWSDTPLINMEDNVYHPCQGMSDVMTLRERFGRDFRGRKVAVSWTNSPVTGAPPAPTHDFMYAASFFGPDIVFAHPPELRIDPEIETAIKANVEANGGSYSVVDEMDAAFVDADVVMAKNYVALDLLPPVTTKPQQPEMLELFAKYKDWITDERRMGLAKPDAGYMHPMACHRNIEVTDGVLDGKWGAWAFDQAENRLHAQKAIMASVIP
jgi:N-acetylornithine carbamoyltransferase